MFEKWIDQNRDDIIAKTQGVLRIDSVGGEPSAPDQPFGPGCAEALDYALQLGQELGFAVKNVDGYAGHIEMGEGEEYIAVLGHLDVVPVGSGWTYPPFGAEIHDGKIYARGAIDDKGPTMAALFAMKAIRESGVQLSKRVRLIMGLDEESNWRCMDHYFTKEPYPVGGFTPDADFPLIYAEKGIYCFNLTKPRGDLASAPVVVRELTGGNRVNMVPDSCRVVLAVTGDAEAVAAQIRDTAAKENVNHQLTVSGGEIVLTVEGLSVHSMAPQHGINAVVQAGKLLRALDTADRDIWAFLSEVDTDGERVGVKMTCHATGPLTCNLGLALVNGEEITFTFNLRFPVDKTDADMLILLEQKTGPEGFRVTDPGIANMKPHYVPLESEIVQTLLKVYAEETGEQAAPLTTGGGTYARAIPNAVAFGAQFPGQPEVAHQKDEFWEVDHLLKCTKIFAKAIYELAK
ncbi:succinyl-diaminopimelate desuccinylase [Tumebacillus sp. BK434]|uniref:dipeptidase PepV n=1 Tax=Tumebacillus sp. BK434 TaxID=2512169 RepID=UPI001042E633|nr:dipeptidase PepV [Tumebacillus sp. BK434]TCP59418.1 succinyl-diaminopimelate desuccinylase [Tumebacillus sp. BK434]